MSNKFKVNLQAEVYELLCGCKVVFKLAEGNRYEIEKVVETWPNCNKRQAHRGEFINGAVVDLLLSSKTDVIRYMRKNKK